MSCMARSAHSMPACTCAAAQQVTVALAWHSPQGVSQPLNSTGNHSPVPRPRGPGPCAASAICT